MGGDGSLPAHWSFKRERSMKRISVNILLAITVVIFVALIVSCGALTQSDTTPLATKAAKVATHPVVDFSLSCVECHEGVTPTITAKWSASGHGRVNFGCYICHGDGEETFAAKPGTDGCISCHSGSMEHLNSVGQTSCFECHDGHTLVAE